MDVLVDTCGRGLAGSLLLLYLLGVTAAADCPQPHEGENMVLTNDALLMNDFLDGSEVTLECRNGYVVESGSGIMTCVNGNWTQPNLTCKKKDCGPPRPQPNMSFNTSAGTLFGDTVKVVCDKGFRLSGSSFRKCYAFGWSGKANCSIVTCDKPSDIANGRSSWDSQDQPKYGEIIQYVCNKGYTLIGKASIVCSETGRYDSPPPACKETSPSTDSSATPTGPSTKSVTTSATPTASPSGGGGRDILTAEGTTTVTSVTSSLFRDEKKDAVDTNKDTGYMPVVVSVICVTIVACIIAFFLHKFLLKRKGSYDTREDLKPELLQFQNL
ncbi:complement decay-accelerating factor isoform X2 [Etheostoma cragini]|uniref:complement decay-accelerating factor isoform X2 n=1 Tax=Etheostoma cragini TaxID=417921 RepID=UPI00155F335C|nr:complement decay-accelerating factor isoform X2 [Etheostoma cragini]